MRYNKDSDTSIVEIILIRIIVIFFSFNINSNKTTFKWLGIK